MSETLIEVKEKESGGESNLIIPMNSGWVATNDTFGEGWYPQSPSITQSESGLRIQQTAPGTISERWAKGSCNYWLPIDFTKHNKIKLTKSGGAGSLARLYINIVNDRPSNSGTTQTADARTWSVVTDTENQTEFDISSVIGVGFLAFTTLIYFNRSLDITISNITIL